MKFLTDRHEIAEEINIKGTPVLTVDIAHCMRGYDNCYGGSKVSVLGGRRPGYESLKARCDVRMYGDEPGNACHEMPWMYGSIVLSSGCVGIKASFGLSDVDEMVEWSNTRTVKPGDKVIIFFRGAGVGYLRMMRIPDRVDPHCSVVCVLEDID